MEVQVERDLVFAAPDGSELALDIYRAPQDDAPVTIYVHGGGWRGGAVATKPARGPSASPGPWPAQRNRRRGTRQSRPAALHTERPASSVPEFRYSY